MERERRMAAVPQQFMVIKNNNAEGDICFNEHVIKPGEELRLPMMPLPPAGWAGTLNDLVAVDPSKTLAAEHLRRTWGSGVTITNDSDVPVYVSPVHVSVEKPLKRIDKIAKY